MTIVLSAIPSASSWSSSSPTHLSWSIIASWYSDCQRPDWPRLSGFGWVRKCIFEEFVHTKNGLFALTWRAMKSLVLPAISSSIVSMRFDVSCPVSSIVCVPSAFALQARPPPRAEILAEVRIVLFGRIVALFGLLAGVEVEEEAEELVEAVHRRQELVLVAEMVLAELSGGVTERPEQFGDGGILCPQAKIRARKPYLAQAGAKDALPRHERRAAGGATLLAIAVGEDHPLLCEPIDIRRPVAHHAAAVGADVGLSDVVAPDHQDVGLPLSHLSVSPTYCVRVPHMADAIAFSWPLSSCTPAGWNDSRGMSPFADDAGAALVRGSCQRRMAKHPRESTHASRRARTRG